MLMCLLKFDVTQDIPESFEVQDPTWKTFIQEVGFDWKPEYCKSRLKLGHYCAKNQGR